jgi:hypothetical protein
MENLFFYVATQKDPSYKSCRHWKDAHLSTKNGANIRKFAIELTQTKLN